MPLEIITTGFDQYLGGNTNVKALILGEPGAGKTRWSSFWPKPFFAGAEDGAMSLADRSVPFAKLKTSKDMDELLLLMNTECRKPRPERKALTLVIDTIDKYQRLVIDERLRAEGKSRLQGFDDWGYIDAKMQQLIAKLGNLDMNVVVCCHVKDKTEETEAGEKQLIVGPYLKGDIKDQIAAEFDFVGYMGSDWTTVTGQTEPVLRRAIRWWPSPKFPILKDRSGQLPKYTPVTFSADDYDSLMGHLLAPLNDLPESTLLETVETADDRAVKPVGPLAGGPTDTAATPPPAKAPAKKAAAKAAAKTEPAPAPEAVDPDAGGSAGAAASPAGDQAVAGADSAPTTDHTSPAAVAEETPATPVAVDSAPQTAEEALENLAAGGITGEVEQVGSTDVPTEDDSTAPAEGAEDQRHCGDGVDGAAGLYNGCGKSLAEENEDLVGLSVIKFRTYLCAADYKTAKTGANKKES